MRYGDAAILCGLCLRAVFGLTLRQTHGFRQDLTRLPGLTIEIPHCSTFFRRPAALCVPKLARPADGRVHLAIDATGREVQGEGAWKRRAHGPGRRRAWRKLHLAVDTRTVALLAHALTAGGVHDGAGLEGVLADIDAPIAAACADRADDSLTAVPPSSPATLGRGIPPRKGAAIRPPPGRKDLPSTRGAAAARIAEIGRDPWKAETGCHRRSSAETAMPRYKALIGPNLGSRTFDLQKAEAAVVMRCINRFTALGMPQSVRND